MRECARAATIEIVKLGDVAKIISGQVAAWQRRYNETGNGLPFYQGKADFGEIWLDPHRVCDNDEVTKLCATRDVRA